MAKGPEKKIVSSCPMCSNPLAISRLACTHCDTVIDSVLPIPPFFRLPEDLQQFAMVFLRCRGNIREVERELGISYPTVCKRLDMLNALLGNTGETVTSNQVLERLERGEISAKDAAQLLKRR